MRTKETTASGSTSAPGLRSARQGRRCLARMAIGALALAASARTAAATSAAEEVRRLYERFYTAQNARDLATVRTLLWDSPKFLWISDGMPFWGPDALIARMGEFQKLPVWHVEPDLGKAVTVELGPSTAYLHLPLALTLNADRFRFLVEMLAVETTAGWRIAALFTTNENPG